MFTTKQTNLITLTAILPIMYIGIKKLVPYINSGIPKTKFVEKHVATNDLSKRLHDRNLLCTYQQIMRPLPIVPEHFERTQRRLLDMFRDINESMIEHLRAGDICFHISLETTDKGYAEILKHQVTKFLQDSGYDSSTVHVSDCTMFIDLIGIE